MSHSQTENTLEQDEPFWLDYLEGELEAELHDDVELLLAHSSHNREIVDGLEQTKRILKASDEDVLPEDGRYYQELHDRVMAKVAQAKIETPKKWKWTRAAKLPSFLMMSGLFALTLAVLSSHRANTSFEGVLQASLKNPSEVFQTVLSDEIEGDFVFDAAQRKINLNSKEAQHLIESTFN